MKRRIERTRGGDYRVRLEGEERELLRTLPPQLRELLAEGDDGDPSVRRLFPPAYVGDEEHEDEYRRLMGDDLREHHLQAIAIMESTIDQERLAEGELVAWLSAVNDLRLVIGTRLDVSEDMDYDAIAPDDPRGTGLALYSYLSWLEEQMVEALASSLPG
ncbi:MAG TPA: DUF2017 family protein [Acidimicrobiales bacterium]|nr:DUF2017 family protein [Acidimicrobiales bacterium]